MTIDERLAAIRTALAEEYAACQKAQDLDAQAFEARRQELKARITAEALVRNLVNELRPTEWTPITLWDGSSEGNY